jgi:hypothetical protein
VHSNSFRTVRGRTLVACIFDEVSFWRDETSATPDLEVYRAVLPALATTNGMLIGISTPYRKQGLLHQKHRDHFGVADDDVLVVQGTSKQFNPSLSDSAIAAQRSADPAAAPSEWDAEFRTDLSAYLDEATIERAIEYDRPLELPPRLGYRAYRAFVDASGGVGSDSYTLAIGHKEKRGADEVFIVDMVRGYRQRELADTTAWQRGKAQYCPSCGYDLSAGDDLTRAGGSEQGDAALSNPHSRHFDLDGAKAARARAYADVESEQANAWKKGKA